MYLGVKRILDIILSFIGLIVLLPFLFIWLWQSNLPWQN